MQSDRTKSDVPEQADKSGLGFPSSSPRRDFLKEAARQKPTAVPKSLDTSEPGNSPESHGANLSGDRCREERESTPEAERNRRRHQAFHEEKSAIRAEAYAKSLEEKMLDAIENNNLKKYEKHVTEYEKIIIEEYENAGKAGNTSAMNIFEDKITALERSSHYQDWMKSFKEGSKRGRSKESSGSPAEDGEIREPKGPLKKRLKEDTPPPVAGTSKTDSSLEISVLTDHLLSSSSSSDDFKDLTIEQYTKVVKEATERKKNGDIDTHDWNEFVKKIDAAESAKEMDKKREKAMADAEQLAKRIRKKIEEQSMK